MTEMKSCSRPCNMSKEPQKVKLFNQLKKVAPLTVRKMPIKIVKFQKRHSREKKAKFYQVKMKKQYSI